MATKPLLKQLKGLGTAAVPFSTNLASLFTSLKQTGGLERIMDFIFLGAGAANGYDALGHFLRTEGVGGICVKYQPEQTPAATATWRRAGKRPPQRPASAPAPTCRCSGRSP